MFVSGVHSVIVLSAMFCTVCSLLVFVSAMIGDHLVFAYSSMGRMIILYVTISFSLDLHQCVVVSGLNMLVDCIAGVGDVCCHVMSQ